MRIKTLILALVLGLFAPFCAQAEELDGGQDYVEAVIADSFVKKVAISPVNAFALKKIFNVSIYQTDLEMQSPNGAANLLGTQYGFIYNGKFTVPNLRYQNELVALQQVIRPEFVLRNRLDAEMLKDALNVLFPQSQRNFRHTQERMMYQASSNVWVYVRGMAMENLAGFVIYTDEQGRITRILNTLDLKAMFG